MPVTVRMPTALQKFTGGLDTLSIEGNSVAELIENMETQFPGVKKRLCDDEGALRRFVNIYVNGEDIRFKSGLETELADGREVSIVPSIAGG